MLCLINVSRRVDLKRYSNEERGRSARMRARIKAAESPNKTVDCDASRAKLRFVDRYFIYSFKSNVDVMV